MANKQVKIYLNFTINFRTCCYLAQIKSCVFCTDTSTTCSIAWYIYRLVISETNECTEPPLVNNAHHDRDPSQTMFALGTMLQYDCLTGFTMMRDGVQRAWCVVGGFWVGPNMTCDSEFNRGDYSLLHSYMFLFQWGHLPS